MRNTALNPTIWFKLLRTYKVFRIDKARSAQGTTSAGMRLAMGIDYYLDLWTHVAWE